MIILILYTRLRHREYVVMNLFTERVQFVSSLFSLDLYSDRLWFRMGVVVIVKFTPDVWETVRCSSTQVLNPPSQHLLKPTELFH